MEPVRVQAGECAYSVLIEPGILRRAGEMVREHLEGDRVVVLADANAAVHHGPALRGSLRRAKLRVLDWIEVPAGERVKSLARARTLYDRLVESGADRWTPLLVLGGGVPGDLAGFVASTFMRGLPLVQIPTTLVAQVDSSVGGKTAVNFSGAKNLIGTFHQPSLVITDPNTLSTLPGREYRGGLAEVVKIAMTLRPDLLERMENEREAVAAGDPGILVDVIRACVEAKAEVVSRDEKDRDVRSVLNYGHTVGHALEAAARGKLRHGEAVAVGMNAAAWIGDELGVAAAGVRDRQNRLLSGLGLKTVAQIADNRAVARNLKLDKKVRGRRNRFVLTLQIGGASVWPHIPGRLIRRSVAQVTSRSAG